MKFKSTKQFVSYLFEATALLDPSGNQVLDDRGNAIYHDANRNRVDHLFGQGPFDPNPKGQAEYLYHTSKKYYDNENKRKSQEAQQAAEKAARALEKLTAEYKAAMKRLKDPKYQSPHHQEMLKDIVNQLKESFPQIKAIVEQIKTVKEQLKRFPPIEKMKEFLNLNVHPTKRAEVQSKYFELTEKLEELEKNLNNEYANLEKSIEPESAQLELPGLKESIIRKELLNYLFEADQMNKTDDILDFLNGKLEGKKLYIDDEIMEKLNSLKGVQLTKALEWFYEKPVTMTYDKDITNKYKGSSSITNYIKNLMREKEVEVPEKLKESHFDLNRWQKMARNIVE